MLEGWRDFVLKLLAIDRLAASPSAGRVTALDHEVRYYAVKDKAIEIVALRKASKVLACLGRVVVVELNRDEALEPSVSAPIFGIVNIRQWYRARLQ